MLTTTTKRSRILAFCFMLCVVECASAPAEMGPSIPDHKKIIGFAVSTVQPAYLREHIADIERLPIDGLNIFVYPDDWGPRRTGQEGMFFGGRRFKRADFSQALADLKATPFKRFTDNFIQVETSARGSAVTGNPEDGNLGWFDPNWDGIAENGAVVAWLAKEAGFKGIFLDVEHYAGTLGPFAGKNLFDYEGCPSSQTHTLDEVAAQIQLRGRQFMKAVVDAYPDITIVIIQNTGWGRHNLVEFFVRGMLEARGRASIVDGGEGGYHMVIHKEFAALVGGAKSRHSQDKLFAPVEYAIGVWVDRWPNKYGGWHTDPADFHKNYRSPRELEHTLYGALTEVDTYVWLYIVHPNVWFTPVVRPRPMLSQCVLCPHEKVPDEYVQALVDCRKPHDLDWAPKVSAGRLFDFDDAVLVEGGRITEHQPNLLTNPGFEQWSLGADSRPVDWVVTGQGPVIVREETDVKAGKYAARLTTSLPQGHVIIDKRLPAARFAGKTVTVGVWVRSRMAGIAGVQILDFVQGMHQVSHGTGPGDPGDGKWHFITATRKIRADATGEVVFRLSAGVPFIKEFD